MRGRPGRGGAGGRGTPDSTGTRSPETGAGGLPFRVRPPRSPESSDIAAHDPVILSDHDLAVIQKAVAAARQDGKDDRRDAAAGQHGAGPGPAPPAEEPRETWPPEPRCSAPPPVITQARVISALILVPGPGRAVGGADSAPELAAVRRLNENRIRRRRRLLLYALAAVSIVVAAALADHGGVLPRVGANTSPTQVGGPPQLLPPLDQPPVMHFSNAVDATSAPGSPQPAMGDSSGGGPSTIARGG